MRNLRPQAHPWNYDWMPPEFFDLLITFFREDKRRKDAANRVMGKTKQPYYPLRDFDPQEFMRWKK
jgi:hypothetical protein